MALVLTRFPRDRRGALLDVALATRPSEIEDVQRIRHRIYVREASVLDEDHAYVQGDRLVDPYDAWSSHLVLRRDGVPVGTVRITEAADGRLELDESVDIRPLLRAGARPAELTRFMVLREERRTQAAPLLLYAAFRVIAASSATHLVAAAKVGSLGRYYRHAGLRVLDAEPFTYALTGATYELGTIDLGAPRSARRAGLSALYGGLKAVGGHVTPVVHFVFRRRLSASPATQATPTHIESARTA